MKYRTCCGPIRCMHCHSRLIDQYARSMTNKNTIKNAIDYFHMEAPSATVSMKLGSDLQTTLMAVGLCRISGTHLGIGLEDAKASTACVFGCRGHYHKFIHSLGRQANYLYLLAIGYAEIIESILWLNDHSCGYSSLETVFVLLIECVGN